MRQETEGEELTRAGGDVRTPSADWKDEWVHLKLPSFVSTALVELVRTQNAGIRRLALAFERVRRVQ